jgi:hypothetical protein
MDNEADCKQLFDGLKEGVQTKYENVHMASPYLNV